MTTVFLAQDIESEEGRRYAAYADPKTGGAPFTIGIGHTDPSIHLGITWTNAQINAALNADILHATRMLDQYQPWWRSSLDDVRQDVLVQMVFQMGIGGLAKFPKALAAMHANDWQAAYNNMLDSEWARSDSPARALREAKQMLTGVRSWATPAQSTLSESALQTAQALEP